MPLRGGWIDGGRREGGRKLGQHNRDSRDEILEENLKIRAVSPQMGSEHFERI
jgi:hypothetical protein